MEYISLLSKVAIVFWFNWSNQFFGLILSVPLASPDEFRRAGLVISVAFTGPGRPSSPRKKDPQGWPEKICRHEGLL
jgi:hypothetical protein